MQNTVIMQDEINLYCMLNELPPNNIPKNVKESNSMLKTFIILGSVNAFLSVALGAFGAHGLKSKISSDMLAVYQTGVQYHMIHSIGLILIAILSEKLLPSYLVTWSGWSLFIGIILFSGSLYALSISGIRVLGAITPLGGLAFLLGWTLLATAAFKSF
jgi:uncharacterized membrane protein YgdD (TMEM256/DUF423 family)